MGAGDAPAKVSNEVCGAYFGCDCDDERNDFTSFEQCRAEIQANVQEVIDEGEAQGLSYDGSCVGNVEKIYNALDCKSAAQLILEADNQAIFVEADECKLFFGDKQAGDSCDGLRSEAGDDCAKDLVCVDGRCRAKPSSDASGRGESCGETSDCEPGLACVQVQTSGGQTCEELPGPGGTCLGGFDLCEPQSFCDQADKKCRALPRAGQACAPSASILLQRCDLNSVCENDTCEAAPVGGESCVLKCADGFACESGICVRPEPLACATGALFGD